MLSDGVVTLRRLRPEDADTVVAHLQDPEIPRWTRIPSPYGHADFAQWLEIVAEAWATGTGLHLAVTREGEDRVIGAVGVQSLDTPRPDIGYWIAREARRQGLTARAVRLLRDHLAAEHGCTRIDIYVDAGNAPSQRTAMAAGFQATGEYRRDPRPNLEGEFMVFVWPEDAGAGAGGG
jgi:RimJ/RimL family protein N-acetyltransferase